MAEIMGIPFGLDGHLAAWVVGHLAGTSADSLIVDKDSNRLTPNRTDPEASDKPSDNGSRQ